jgi:uncharacterized protein
MNASEHCLGYVVAVTGSRIAGVLDRAAAADLQLGSLVKIATPRTVAFGLVSSLSIQNPSSPPAPSDRGLMHIDLLGETVSGGGGGAFRRGVSMFPALGESIAATSREDLALVYAKPATSCVRVGSLHQDAAIAAHVLIDDLLGQHFAILGTTGSGKSCSVAVILRSVLQSHPGGHIVLLDPHNEYAHCFGDSALSLTTDELQLPYWFLNFEETVEALCGVEDVSREIESGILREAMVTAKHDYLAAQNADFNLTVDTPTPYRLTRLVELLREGMGKLDKPENALPYMRLISRIDSLRRDARFAFMFSSLVLGDVLAEVMTQILRIPVDEKPITIVSLAGVPSEIVDVVVSLLCRMIFDFALWSNRDRAVPVLLVCEEAHRYIPRDGAPGRQAGQGFGPTRKAISRIAKEGRKYGVSLGLITQRPSEISETILSQCNTLFALRMSNEQDQDFVRRALPDTAAGLLGALPSLRTQEAIVVGEGVTVPMRLRFDDLEAGKRPKSQTAPFSACWRQKAEHGDDVKQTIERWRKQTS